jgi:hypothetical protein
MGAGRQETPLSRSKVAAMVCRMASIGHGAPWPSSPVHGREIEGGSLLFLGTDRVRDYLRDRFSGGAFHCLERGNLGHSLDRFICWQTAAPP